MTLALTHWSRDVPIVRGQLVTAALGMAVPVAYGVATDHLGHGSFAALGALATSGTAVRAQGGVGVVVTVAALLGVSLAGHGWLGAAGVVLLAAVAALVGGFSRWMAEATTRFTVFLVLTTGLGAADTWEVTRWFAVGAGWAIVLGLAAALFAGAGAVPAQPTYRQLWRRWWSMLHRFEGWQYVVRLAGALAAAEVIGVLWHQEKSYWIALTVVIVVRRRGGSLLRATERCVGTTAGVVVGGALILWSPPPWVIVGVVGVLAGLRSLVRERNYAAYAAVMTPLLVVLMDLGRTPELSTVGYRLIDTAIGCLLAIAPTLILRRTHVD